MDKGSAQNPGRGEKGAPRVRFYPLGDKTKRKSPMGITEFGHSGLNLTSKVRIACRNPQEGFFRSRSASVRNLVSQQSGTSLRGTKSARRFLRSQNVKKWYISSVPKCDRRNSFSSVFVLRSGFTLASMYRATSDRRAISSLFPVPSIFHRSTGSTSRSWIAKHKCAMRENLLQYNSMVS